jgi:hypothetical protein
MMKRRKPKRENVQRNPVSQVNELPRPEGMARLSNQIRKLFFDGTDSSDDLRIVRTRIPRRFNMGFFDEVAGGFLKNVFSGKDAQGGMLENVTGLLKSSGLTSGSSYYNCGAKAIIHSGLQEHLVARIHLKCEYKFIL